MKDFIFGTLATEELRYEHVRTRRAGVSHYQKRNPLDPLPGQEIMVELEVGPGSPYEHAWLYWTNDGTDPAGDHGVATNGTAVPMQCLEVTWDTVLWGYIRRFQGIIPGQAAGKIVRYRLAAGSAQAEEIEADHGAIYACYIDDDPPPAWSRDAIVYQIFVDRFYPGDGKGWLSPESPAGFYGGTLKGTMDKLGYLADLGVNVLWLTPIFPSPSHHGYDATDLFEIEPRLGTKRDLRNLLDAAHQRKIRVLLDLVPNHVSWMHPTFQSALHEPASVYRNWYSFTQWPDQYETFFGVKELPQLNLRNPDARKYMLDAAAYWLEFGVDGYRVDYAIGPAPDFWADFRKVTRQIKPDSWTFGEVVEPPDAQLAFTGGLDGCLDFNMLEAIRMGFAFGDWNASQFASYLSRHEAFFPEEFSRPSFLDNHDMNRFLWAVQGNKDRLRLAAMCQFSLSGQPVIYYGTEVGLSQLRDVRQGEAGLPEESRLPMMWGDNQDQELLDYYRQLIHLRKAYPALEIGRANILFSDEDGLLYTRGDHDSILVALNLSDNNKIMELQGQWNTILLETKPGTCKLNHSKINLAPLGGVILTR